MNCWFEMVQCISSSSSGRIYWIPWFISSVINSLALALTLFTYYYFTFSACSYRLEGFRRIIQSTHNFRDDLASRSQPSFKFTVCPKRQQSKRAGRRLGYPKTTFPRTIWWKRFINDDDWQPRGRLSVFSWLFWSMMMIMHDPSQSLLLVRQNY